MRITLPSEKSCPNTFFAAASIYFSEPLGKTLPGDKLKNNLTTVMIIIIH